MSSWKTAAIAVVIVVQVVVPLVAFLGEPPTRFGFQMYSAVGSTAVEVTTLDGRPVPYDQSNLPSSLRPEFDWIRRIPEHVCATVPQAHVVTVVQRPGGRRSLVCD